MTPGAASPVVIAGAGGLGRETAAALRAVAAVGGGLELHGFLDDAATRWGTTIDGVPVLGSFDLVHDLPSEVRVVLATGSTRDLASRLRVSGRLALPPERYVSVVHPGAALADSCTLGPGCVVLAGVVATASVRIGAHVVLMPQVVLTHDNVVDDGATFAAGVRLAGTVHVGAGAYLGAGALVREQVKIGAGALVGMGAVVLTDVPAGETWVGNPARHLRTHPSNGEALP